MSQSFLIAGTTGYQGRQQLAISSRETPLFTL
jgi:hypothetical protein